MKVLVFSDHFYPEPSSPAAHIYERASAWVSAGHDVTVICSAPNFPEGRVYPGYRNAWRHVETLAGIRVVRVKTFVSPNEGTLRRAADYFSYMFSAWFFSLFERKPDVIMSSSPHILIAVAGVATAVCRRVPHVFEIRDLWPASIAATGMLEKGFSLRCLEKIELWLYRRSRRILAFTPSFREDLKSRGVDPGKIDVVINGANLSLFRPMKSKDSALLAQYGLEGKFVIGYLGTLGLAHGLENIVAVAEKVRDTNLCFFFVGVGAAKNGLKERVIEARLNNVVFAPRQLKEDMPRFWSVCDASLIHLKNDPVFSKVIPSKIFESMAVGLPILYAGPPGDGSSIVEQHDVGLIVPAMQPDALATAALRLEKDGPMRERLARNGAAAAGDFSRDKQSTKTLAVLAKALQADG